MAGKMTVNAKKSLTQLINARKQKEQARPVEMSEEERIEHLKHWTTFYRRNLSIYVRDRLGIRLEPYQHLMLWLMSKSMMFVGICARGSSKSFIMGIYAIAMCLLYPRYQVVVVASTIPQGMVIYNKIRNELCGGTSKDGLSPLLSYLYKKDSIHFRTSDTALEIDIKLTNSKITVLPPLDSSRGARANLLIYDEFRLLKKSDVDSIFEPMGFRRQSEFLNLDEYANRQDMVEEAQSAYISSSGWKTDWLWNLSKKTITSMLNNDVTTPSNLFACDVFLPMQYNRITVPQYNKLKSQMSTISFRMEMLNECLGEAEDAFFKLEEFKANQILPKGFRTPTTTEYLTHVDMGNRPKKENEFRILGVDFAFEQTMKSGDNDNTSITLLSCFWNGERLVRNTEYIETLVGGGYPVKRIKEIYYDLDIDWIAYDSKNGGDVYAQEFTESYMHEERGVEFRGFTSAVEEELQVANINKVNALSDKTIDVNAIPCLIPVTASSDFNSLIWQDLKVRLQRGDIRFLIGEFELEEMNESTKAKRMAWSKYTSEEKMRIKLPHVQTEFLCEEMINLTAHYKEGKVKLTEPRSGFKDRAVSLAYANYIATLLENKLAREHNDIDYNDINDWTLVI